MEISSWMFILINKSLSKDIEEKFGSTLLSLKHCRAVVWRIGWRRESSLKVRHGGSEAGRHQGLRLGMARQGARDPKHQVRCVVKKTRKHHNYLSILEKRSAAL